jgi:hypothetical protein
MTFLSWLVTLGIINFMPNEKYFYIPLRGSRGGRSWLRHFATSRYFVGSIPDGVAGIFHWQSFRPHYGPGVDSASNRNEYQESKDGRFVGLTTFPPSCTECLEIWEPQPAGTLWTCNGLYRDCFTIPLPLPSASLIPLLFTQAYIVVKVLLLFAVGL